MKKFMYTPLALLKYIHLFILSGKSVEVWESKKRRKEKCPQNCCSPSVYVGLSSQLTSNFSLYI